MTPKDWVVEFVGNGKTREEIVRAAERMGWDEHVVDDAIEDARACDDIENASYAAGFVMGSVAAIQPPRPSPRSSTFYKPPVTWRRKR